MESVLVKILAVVLALSQVSTRPDEVKTHFDSTADRAQVLELLRAGCDHMRKVFKVENLPLDDLVETALADPKIATSQVKEFHGLNFGDLAPTYRELCKNEMPDPSPVDLAAVIDFYDKAAANLPDHTRLKGLRLASPSEVVDARQVHFAELYEPGNRRIAVPLAQIPEFVQRAFVSAEDQRFFAHKGIDERGLVRAFVVNMMAPGRPQGGSTITQQVVKNVLVGDDVTYERKVREIIVTSRLEQTLTKPEILELYLNSIYFGRNSWGVEMAARSWFGKSIKDVTLAEGALLAGLVKGPNYFSPDRAPDRARERLDYVLGRMKEDGAITADQLKQQDKLPRVIPLPRRRKEASRYFFDYLTREVKTLPGLVPLANATYTIHSTIYPALQSATEAALQEGLAQYEIDNGRVDFKGPEANLADAIHEIDAARAAALTPTDAAPPTDAATPPAAPADAPAASPGVPDWQQALTDAYLPLLDVHWTPAIVLDRAATKRGAGLRVGLADGRILPLHTGSAAIESRLQIDDVIFVRVIEGKGRNTAHADLRVRPTVGRRDRHREQDRPHSRDGGRLLLRRESAQSHRPDAPPARLDREAARLSRGPARRAAAQHDHSRRAGHAAADPGRPREGLLVAAQLRRRLMGRRHAAPRAGEFAQPRDRRAARRRHRLDTGAEPRPRVRARRGSAALRAVPALLSDRARRPAGAHDRSRRVLRRDRQ